MNDVQLCRGINNKTSFPAENFTLFINHPEREDIKQKNNDYLDKDGKLKKNILKSTCLLFSSLSKGLFVMGYVPQKRER